jgi:hypothetical protein
MLPLVPSVLRGVAAGGRTPYDATTTWGLVTRSRPDWQLFRPEPEAPRSSEPLVPRAGPVPVPLNPWLAVLGLNVHRRSQEASAGATSTGSSASRRPGARPLAGSPRSTAPELACQGCATWLRRGDI